jgi:hypothetical protein
MSVIESMPAFHRRRSQTQPCSIDENAAVIVRYAERRSVAALLTLQLFDQVPQAGGQLGIFRAKILPQPFADRPANRKAGRTIEFFAAIVDGRHLEFRFAFVGGHEQQVICTGIVSRWDELHAIFVKIE